MVRAAVLALTLFGAVQAFAQCTGHEPPTVVISEATLGLGDGVDLKVHTLSGTLTGRRIALADHRSFVLHLSGARVELRDPTVKILLEKALKPTHLDNITFATEKRRIDETARWHLFTIKLGGTVEVANGGLRLSEKPVWWVRPFAPAVLRQSQDRSILMTEDGYVVIDPVNLLKPYLSFTGIVTQIEIGTREMTETFGIAPSLPATPLVTLSGAGVGQMLGLNVDAGEVTISSASGRLDLRLSDIAAQLRSGTTSQNGCTIHVTLP